VRIAGPTSGKVGLVALDVKIRPQVSGIKDGRQYHDQFVRSENVFQFQGRSRRVVLGGLASRSDGYHAMG